MKRFLITIPILFLAFFVYPQTDAPWYMEKPIIDIEFEGLDTVSKNELTLIIEPFIDVPFTNAVLVDIQDRLYALDYFEQIIPNAVRVDDNETAVILRFDVVERPSVTKIVFSGNRGIGR